MADALSKMLVSEQAQTLNEKIDVEKLDYGYISSCENVQELECILSILKYVHRDIDFCAVHAKGQDRKDYIHTWRNSPKNDYYRYVQRKFCRCPAPVYLLYYYLYVFIDVLAWILFVAIIYHVDPWTKKCQKSTVNKSWLN